MTGVVEYWVDVLQGLGIVLIATGSLLSFAAHSKEPSKRGDGLTGRARFMVSYRRQPRLWSGSLACLLAGLIFYLSYLAVRFG